MNMAELRQEGSENRNTINQFTVAKEYGAKRAAEAEQLASRTAWARSPADWGLHRAAWSEFLPRARPAWQEMLPQQGPVTVQLQVQEEGPAAMRQRRLPPFPCLGECSSS